MMQDMVGPFINISGLQTHLASKVGVSKRGQLKFGYLILVWIVRTVTDRRKLLEPFSYGYQLTIHNKHLFMRFKADKKSYFSKKFGSVKQIDT